MIWLKRLVPFLVIAAGWFGYTFWTDSSAAQRQAEEDRLARVTAQVWIATAKYRDDPDRFLAYRDSLLDAYNVPREEVFSFLDRREDQPEEMLPFAREVQRLVDSLKRVEDSLHREARIQAHDSAEAAAAGE